MQKEEFMDSEIATLPKFSFAFLSLSLSLRELIYGAV